MILYFYLAIIILSLLAVTILSLRRSHRRRLLNLYSKGNSLKFGKQGVVSEQYVEEWTNSCEDRGIVTLEALKSRLGQAGFLTSAERRAVYRLAGVGSAAIVVFFSILGFQQGGSRGLVLALIVSAYLCLMAFLYYLRFRRADFQREVLFQMPITLESMVLLVESGLGILPAIEQLVKMQERQGQTNPVGRIMGLVYRISAGGIPFSQALEMVASSIDIRAVRHVLLHLDVSSAEGGRLVPALRSLSDHAHQEWKLGVETRVRRLENLVVFPVFISVMGLLLLTAAVPVVPLVEFAKSLNSESLNNSVAPKLKAD